MFPRCPLPVQYLSLRRPNISELLDSSITYQRQQRGCLYYIHRDPDSLRHDICMIKASSSFCAFSDTLILFFNFQVIWEITGIIRTLGVLIKVPEINVSSPANPLPPCPACRTWYVGKFYSQIFKWLCRASDNASLQTSRTVFFPFCSRGSTMSDHWRNFLFLPSSHFLQWGN